MKEHKFLAFDIEITKVVKGNDWLAQRPLGISVAATLPEDSTARSWYGQGRPSREPWSQMPRAQVQVLVTYLQNMTAEGYTLLTWNGLGFDLNVLAEESGLLYECRDLAMDMVDPMFHFYWEHGYPVGLQAVARGMGLFGKTGTGAEAPVKWAEGRYQEVIDYCIQDTQVLLDVTRATEICGHLYWYSREGNLQKWVIEGKRLLTVEETMQTPAPVNPWLPVENFTGWLLERDAP